MSFVTAQPIDLWVSADASLPTTSAIGMGTASLSAIEGSPRPAADAVWAPTTLRFAAPAKTSRATSARAAAIHRQTRSVIVSPVRTNAPATG